MRDAISVPRTLEAPRNKEWEHLFVSNVRFWSMAAIVAIHCAGIVDMPGGMRSELLQAVFTPLKFGTIGFFLISGFLLGERVDRWTAKQYFQLRVRKVLPPWILWFAGYVVLTILLHRPESRAAAAAGKSATHIYGHWVLSSLFFSPFWFVPNLLVALGILLICRRHLDKVGFGVLLGLIDLYYVVCRYTRFAETRHTENVLAFIFFLWLGTYAARHFGRLQAALARVSMALLATLTVLAALLSFGEARLLTALNRPDPISTLRGSNQIFAILVALLFIKVARRTYPGFVEVRNHTYGVYLTHSLFLLGLAAMLGDRLKTGPLSGFFMTDAGRMTLWLLTFLLTYGCCWLLCRWLARQPRLSWTVGVTVRRAATAPLASERAEERRAEEWRAEERLAQKFREQIVPIA